MEIMPSMEMSHTCTVVCRCLVVRGRALSFARLSVFLSVVSPLVCSLVFVWPVCAVYCEGGIARYFTKED